jgi:hypothetical protein
VESVAVPEQAEQPDVLFTDCVTGKGSVIATVPNPTQPMASLTTKVYVPAHNAVAVDENGPELQLYVKGPAPPITLVHVAVPLQAPLQVLFVALITGIIIGGSVIQTDT